MASLSSTSRKTDTSVGGLVNTPRGTPAAPAYSGDPEKVSDRERRQQRVYGRVRSGPVSPVTEGSSGLVRGSSDSDDIVSGLGE